MDLPHYFRGMVEDDIPEPQAYMEKPIKAIEFVETVVSIIGIIRSHLGVALLEISVGFSTVPFGQLDLKVQDSMLVCAPVMAQPQAPRRGQRLRCTPRIPCRRRPRSPQTRPT